MQSLAPSLCRPPTSFTIYHPAKIGWRAEVARGRVVGASPHPPRHHFIVIVIAVVIGGGGGGGGRSTAKKLLWIDQR